MTGTPVTHPASVDVVEPDLATVPAPATGPGSLEEAGPAAEAARVKASALSARGEGEPMPSAPPGR